MTHPTPAQPRTPDSPTPASAGPYAPGQPMPSDEQITTYLEMESYMARALAHTTDGSSIEERAAIAVRFVRAAVAEPPASRVPAQPEGEKASDRPPEACACCDDVYNCSTADGKVLKALRASAPDATLRTLASELCEAGEKRFPYKPNDQMSADTIALMHAITRLSAHLASVPASPPAPQPEAATGERPKCPRCGRSDKVMEASATDHKGEMTCHRCNGWGSDGALYFTPAAPPPPTVETAEPAPDPLEAEDIACIREHRAASRVVLMYDDEYSDTPRRWPWESYMDADPARIAKAREKSTLPNVATRRPRLYVRDDAEWRSVPLVVLPTRVDEQTAPTVTLPLADAEDIDRVLALSGWDRSCKGAIVLREAIERAKP